ncbi:MAG: DNA primase [Candidatus Moranbacteria bacterium]|jgi:DNA primase|nr:DNA primase [Candidatus Moranbacteria bacterium]
MDGTAVNDIKARLNVVDVVGGYLRLTKSGTHWKACCPFHNEKSPSFMVNEERQIWHCFGCGKGGDIFSFVEEIEGVEFREALKLLAEKAGVELPKYRRDSVFSQGGVEEPDRTKEILELSTKFYEKQLWDGVGKRTALPYLRKRGLADESIRHFRLGYAPEGWRHIFDFLVSRGYREQEIEKAGLSIRKEGGSGQYDRFRDRIMFPISDIVGRIIGYSARVAPGGDESQAKYINTPETPVYHKSRVLYGLYQAKQAVKERGFSVLVEGQMDVIACHQAGIGNTIAASGTALTAEQLDILKRYGKEIRLFFDMDGAGQAAAWKSAMLAFEKELETAVISLPHGKDAADAALENADVLRKAVETPKPAAKYFLEKLVAGNDPRTANGKRAIAEGYAPLLLSMKNPIDRGFWQKALSDAIGVEEKTISGVLQDVSLKARDFSHNPGENREASRSEVRQEFIRRADTLRDRLLGLALLSREAFKKVILPETAAAFLREDPVFSLICDSGEGDPMSLVSDEATKRRLSELLFLAERLSEGANDESTAAEREERLIVELVADLFSELRKEERTEIARQLEEARQSGDKDRERMLMERFSELSR